MFDAARRMSVMPDAAVRERIKEEYAHLNREELAALGLIKEQVR